MSETESLILLSLAGLAVIGLYALLWRVTVGRSLAARILVRFALPLLIALPFFALIPLWNAGGDMRSAEMPPVTSEAAPEAMEGGSGLKKKNGSAPKKSAAPGPASANGNSELAREQPVAEEKTESEEMRTRGLAPPAPSQPAAAPPPAPPSSSAAPPPAGGTIADASAPPELDARAAVPQPAPADEKADFSVVPVFFGTDRVRNTASKRLDFGLERSRKLELGQALVSVPKSHEVPQVERPWSIRIPYFDVKVYEETEDPAKHFTMREMRSLTREEFLQLVRERLKTSASFKDHAFIFVHGFNTTFDHAVYRTAQIANDLKFDGASFVYSWPSGGGVASYTYDRESAGQAEPFMRDFMNMVVSESGAKAVSVIAHSMGNQPVLQVLKDMKAAKPNVAINQIILAAPDVDRDNFENIAKEIRGLAKGVTLYVAANDRALSVSRRFHGGVPRAGDVPAGGPLILPGVDTIDITGVSTDSLGINHSGYAENNALLNDISLLIQTGERPPDKRIPILSRVTTPKGEYWRYPVP